MRAGAGLRALRDARRPGRDRGPAPSGEEADVGEVLARAFDADGVELALDTRLVEVERAVGPPTRSRRPGGRRSVEVDAILVAVGREPDVAGLGLANAGVELDSNGAIRVDDRIADDEPPDLCRGRRRRRPAVHPPRRRARASRDPERALRGTREASSLTVPECVHGSGGRRVGHDRTSAAAAGLETRAFVEPGTRSIARLEGECGLHEGPRRGRKRPDRGRHDRRPPRGRGDLDRHARHAVGNRSRRPREPHPPVPDPRAGARSDRRPVPADAARPSSRRSSAAGWRGADREGDARDERLPPGPRPPDPRQPARVRRRHAGVRDPSGPRVRGRGALPARQQNGVGSSAAPKRSSACSSGIRATTQAPVLLEQGRRDLRKRAPSPTRATTGSGSEGSSSLPSVTRRIAEYARVMVDYTLDRIDGWRDGEERTSGAR